MKPKSLPEENWNKLLRKYKDLSLKSWNAIDGLKKLALLRGAKIVLNAIPIFGTFYNTSIYNFDKCKKYTFGITELNKMRHIALEEKNEIGGIIGEDIRFLFNGSKNRIQLNIEGQTKNLTLFHTHPQDEDTEYDPPSVLDMVSFLEFNVKSIAERIINKNVGQLLKVQNSVVFTKNEVYIYYLSNELVVSITKYLLSLRDRADFVYEVEKLLEEIEIHYSFLLSKFNMELTDAQVKEYISYLNSLGFIVHRYTYNQEVEIFKYS
jgi:hypothetical protein